MTVSIQHISKPKWCMQWITSFISVHLSSILSVYLLLWASIIKLFCLAAFWSRPLHFTFPPLHHPLFTDSPVSSFPPLLHFLSAFPFRDHHTANHLPPPPTTLFILFPRAIYLSCPLHVDIVLGLPLGLLPRSSILNILLPVQSLFLLSEHAPSDVLILDLPFIIPSPCHKLMSLLISRTQESSDLLQI